MEIKKLWKAFAFLFLLMLLIFNWADVSWIFNYRAVSGFFSDNFNKEETVQNDVPNVIVLEDQGEYYDKKNSLEISNIEVSAPLVFSQSAEQNDMQKALDTGVVLFPESALPNESGQTIILGHSAPVGWPKIKYDWVFSRLNELVEGDEIIVFFNNRKYVYVVNRKIFLERGEKISQDGLTNNENMLVLISCWPPGKDLRRIAVEANMVK
ncbi:MAG: sortase [Candidatus Nealsonbacteria bacterium]|nr:sortase [Candidatus Nealsonbacteria bacterium]